MAALVLIGLALRPGQHGPTADARSGALPHPRTVATQRREAALRVRMRTVDAAIMAHAPSDSHWIASWAAAPEAPSPQSPLSVHGVDNQTLRQVVMVSSAGAAVRIHLTNRYGTRPLVIGRASVAAADSGGALGGSARLLTFAGRDTVSIPVGASVESDPVSLRVHTLERLAISLYMPVETGALTYRGSAEQSGFLGGGDEVADTGSDWIADTTQNWFVISGVDTLSPSRYIGTVAAIGDSITAGYRSTPGTFGAWPDDLARRFATVSGDRMAVIDEGISGNRVLNPSACCGPSAISRFKADVLEQAGVRAVVLLEGTNDIGFSQDTTPQTAPHTNVSAAQIIAGDKQIIAAAHAAGLKIYGATLLPFKGAGYWTPAGEAKREAVNDWILHGGAFDGVINFAAAMAEPGDPEVMNPALNSGDHLHPNNAGYAVMASTVSLAMLTPPPASPAHVVSAVTRRHAAPHPPAGRRKSAVPADQNE